MAARPCWRCLSRLSIGSDLSASVSTTTRALQSARPFSSSTTLFRDGKTRTLRLSKKKRVKGYKTPAIGERKALRKRVILSNSNALRVDSLGEWDKDALGRRDLTGQVVALTDQCLDALRALEVFKPSQGWGMFNRPATLLRTDTFDLVQALEQASMDPVRRILVGQRGCGKSVLLLQAQAAALMKGWVVIHIPEGLELSSAGTAYRPVPNSSPTKYMQPAYTAALLSRVAKANETVLSNLTAQLDHSKAVSIPLPRNMSLYRLAELGASEPDNAWSIFKALWAELVLPNNNESTSTQRDQEQQTTGARGREQSQPKNEKRPPIMLTLDGIAPVCRLSRYLNPDMHYIHSYDLAVVDHFMSYLSGTHVLPNGGAVVAADSGSARPNTPSVDLAIRRSEERQAAPTDAGGFAGGEAAANALPYDPEHPFDRQDERVLLALRDVSIQRLKGLDQNEARAVLEYYACSGMLRARVTDSFVSEKWALSGGGVISELERSSVGVGHM